MIGMTVRRHTFPRSRNTVVHAITRSYHNQTSLPTCHSHHNVALYYIIVELSMSLSTSRSSTSRRPEHQWETPTLTPLTVSTGETYTSIAVRIEIISYQPNESNLNKQTSWTKPNTESMESHSLSHIDGEGIFSILRIGDSIYSDRSSSTSKVGVSLSLSCLIKGLLMWVLWIIEFSI